MKHTLRSIAFAGFTVITAIAAPRAFDFKDPKGVNAIQFSLDSLLEPIAGSASDVAGTVSFDTADVAATKGKIVVATSSLKTPNATMTEHIAGAKWIDAAKNPEISFEFEKLSDVKSVGANQWSATATGKFTLKGVTKDVTVPVKLSYLADALEKRTRPGNKGDLLVVRGEFSVQRGDFGIQPGENEDKVSPVIQLTFGLVGSAPKA
ncbi:MAG: YceI family protein [Verrucomicrobia bacterium]|nr:YceI family protein [Verrucomicrobiota bacterium]